MTNVQTAPQSATVAVPGARLYYELRGSGPLLALHAAPMGAASFEPLAELLAGEYTVLTSDPRGIGASTVDDREHDVTPDTRADDLAHLLRHVDAGPAVVFGSSGGAVSALALAQRHAELVRTVIAHEPPLAVLVEDREQLRVASEDLVVTYLAGDRRGYWTKFLAMAAIHLPEELVEVFFGTAPEGKEADDERFAVVHMDIPTTFWQPDLAALRRRSGQVIVGIGEDSTGQLCDRTSRALAAELAVEPVIFPGDHIGFVHHPDAFADRLRDVLGR